MKRRSLFAACGSAGVLAGCLSRVRSDRIEEGSPGDDGDEGTFDGDLTAADLERCEESYVVREYDDKRIERVQAGSSVEDVERVDGETRVRIVTALAVDRKRWKYLLVRPAESSEPAGDVPSTDDEPFADLEDVRAAFTAALEADELTWIEQDDGVYAAAEGALTETFGDEVAVDNYSSEWVVVEHDGELLEISHAYEGNDHADGTVMAYYHLVDSAIYRTDDPDAAPTDGDVIDC